MGPHTRPLARTHPGGYLLGMLPPVLIVLTSITSAMASPAVSVGGELRSELIGERLDDLYVETPDAEPGLEFNISRARLRLGARLGEQVSARISLDARARYSETTYTTEGLDSVAVRDFSDGIEVRMRDVWGRWSTPRAGDFTAGLMKNCFGVRCTYEAADGFYFGGVGSFSSMAQRVGLVDSRVEGLKWERGLGERAEVMAMVSNVAPLSEPEQVVGKDSTLRVDVWPLAERLRVTGSAIVGPGGEPGDAYDPTRVAWSGSALARLGRARALVEVMGQSEGAISSLGWNANLAGDVGLSGPLDHLELLARVERWEPDLEVDADGRSTAAAAGNLYWASEEHSLVMTGLLYEVLIPEDTNLAIEHTATAQARFKF